MKRVPGKRTRLQPRDVEVIRFVGSHGYATMPQIKLLAFTGTLDDEYEVASDQVVYRRLKKLRDAGLLTHERTWHSDHGVYRATRSGLALADLDLAPARLDRRDYDHDLRVVDLALALTVSDVGAWITERQIRSRIRPGGSIGRVPDGLLVGDGGERWAVELEVSGKNSQRYLDACHRCARRHRDRLPDDSPCWTPEEHLDSYIGSGGLVDGVVWYFFSPAKRRRASEAAGRIISDREHDGHPTDHLRFEFRDARSPHPPPFGKWRKQKEADREDAESRWREEMRRRTEKRREDAYREASEYLTEAEREGVRLSAARRFDPTMQRKAYEISLREETLEAATDKWRRKERNQERIETVKGWILGR